MEIRALFPTLEARNGVEDLEAVAADVPSDIQPAGVEYAEHLLGQLKLPQRVVRGPVEDNAIAAAIIVIEEQDGGLVEILWRGRRRAQG